MLACPECGSIAIKDIEDYLEGNLLEGDLLECEDCGEIFDEVEAEIVDEESPEYLDGYELVD